MGSDFFWFYDLFVIAIIAAYIFKGFKKGAVAVVISVCATLTAFVAAFAGSRMLSGIIYESTIEKPLCGYIDEQINGITEISLIGGAENIDMKKAVVKDIKLEDITPDFTGGKYILDLSSVDMSKTGIENADLSVFGIPLDFDYSAVQVGNIAIEKTEYKKYGLDNIVLAHVIASNIASRDFKNALIDIGDKISEVVPLGFENYGEQIANGSRDTVYKLTISLLSAKNNNFGRQIINDIISPIILTPLKILIFIILFVLLKLLLNYIADATRIINRIPILSSINQFLGVILSAAEAAILLMVMGIVLKFIIAFFDNSLLFLNEETIDKTVLFRFIYSFDPLRITEYNI